MLLKTEKCGTKIILMVNFIRRPVIIKSGHWSLPEVLHEHQMPG